MDAVEAERQPDIDGEDAICGLIMPITGSLPYVSNHWQKVRAIFEEAVRNADMQPQMVSDSFETDVIQQRILSNVFSNPVVLCDVSGLNPNVMFELGLRLASKKATIIVTDDIKSLPFDTSIIEHVTYPRSLEFPEIRAFIADLTVRIRRAHGQIKTDTYKPFLSNFSALDTANTDLPTLNDIEFIRFQLDDIKSKMSHIVNNNTIPHYTYTMYTLQNVYPSKAEEVANSIRKLSGVTDVSVNDLNGRDSSIALGLDSNQFETLNQRVISMIAEVAPQWRT